MARRDQHKQRQQSGETWLQLMSDWPNAQLRLRERWSRLDDPTLEEISGSRSQLVEKLREAYGFSEQEANRQVDDFVETTWGATSAHHVDTEGRSPGGMSRSGGISSGTPAGSETGARGGNTSGTHARGSSPARGTRHTGHTSGANK